MHARDENRAADLQVYRSIRKVRQSRVITRKSKLFGNPSSRQEMSSGYEQSCTMRAHLAPDGNRLDLAAHVLRWGPGGASLGALSPLERIQVMPLVSLILTLIVVGVLLWLINNFIPMAGSIKTILNAVVVVVVCVWVLNAFGLWTPLLNYRVPR